MSALGAAATAAAVAGSVVAGLRWLRVAQREHYLAGSVSRFAWRWWTLPGWNPLLGVLLVGGAVAAWFTPVGAFAAGAAAAAGPIGLSLKGRTSKLAWTRRLRTLASVVAVLEVAAVGGALAGGAGPFGGALVAAGIPFLVDLAMAFTAPLESWLAMRHVARAKARLARGTPTIVAITGSYGKTSTKGYVAHLVGSVHKVVASPASYNNRAGLARTVNEHLQPGTEVLVAEMGAYGPGEIAALCEFLPPRISVITAIGPMHLERFGTLERTLEAKAEITEKAEIVVLATDDVRLAGLADRLRTEGKRVLRCSSVDATSDVAVIVGEDAGGAADDEAELTLYVGGGRVGSVRVPRDHVPAAPSNAACAVAVALCLDVDPAAALSLLASLPTPKNRLQVYAAQSGFTVIDDTFNSNPVGARLALRLLGDAGAASGRRAVVTPGMVELGPLQASENEKFAALAASVATNVVIVGRTNRAPLLRGVEGGSKKTGSGAVLMADLPSAVKWVRANLGPGDAVLYENDLPDHFP